MSGCCATLPLARCAIRIHSPDHQLPTINAPSDWQPITLDSIALASPYGQDQPLPKNGQSGQMIENQIIQNSISLPQQLFSLAIANFSVE